MKESPEQTITKLLAMLETSVNSLKMIATNHVEFSLGNTTPQTVAENTLNTMKDIQQDGIQVAMPEKKDLPVNQLFDGDELYIPKETDIFFHQCCYCDGFHRVTLRWEKDGLRTYWFRVEKPLTKEEIESQGGSIIQ